jgi:hypothetical protein
MWLRWCAADQLHAEGQFRHIRMTMSVGSRESWVLGDDQNGRPATLWRVASSTSHAHRTGEDF